MEYRRINTAYLREAAAIVRHDGYYFMITSELTGWNFNQAKYFRAKELMGEWEEMENPCKGEGNITTFNSQSTYIFKVEEKEDLYIHMAERHNIQNLMHCSYIWLPIEFKDNHTIELTYKTEWEF